MIPKNNHKMGAAVRKPSVYRVDEDDYYDRKELEFVRMSFTKMFWMHPQKFASSYNASFPTANFVQPKDDVSKLFDTLETTDYSVKKVVETTSDLARDNFANAEKIRLCALKRYVFRTNSPNLGPELYCVMYAVYDALSEEEDVESHPAFHEAFIDDTADNHDYVSPCVIASDSCASIIGSIAMVFKTHMIGKRTGSWTDRWPTFKRLLEDDETGPWFLELLACSFVRMVCVENGYRPRPGQRLN
jgi:hypothetical protein